MDDVRFDGMVKALATSGARRQALRASIGGVLAAALTGINQAADAKKKKGKKKRKKNNNNQVLPPPPPAVQCSNFRQSCTSNAACCGIETGFVACREHLDFGVKATCRAEFPGQRCCALEGSLCNPNNGECDCCDDLICDLVPNTPNEFRCRADE